MYGLNDDLCNSMYITLMILIFYLSITIQQKVKPESKLACLTPPLKGAKPISKLFPLFRQLSVEANRLEIGTAIIYTE